MKKALCILVVFISVLSVKAQLYTEILSPADGSTVKRNQFVFTILWEADYFPATLTVYDNGVIIEQGYFFVSPFTEHIGGTPSRGTHVLQTEALEIDSNGNYLRHLSAPVTVVVR